MKKKLMARIDFHTVEKLEENQLNVLVGGAAGKGFIDKLLDMLGVEINGSCNSGCNSHCHNGNCGCSIR